MFHNLATDIVFLLIKNKVLDIEKRDIYVYGLEVILLNGSLLIVYLLLSLLSKEIITFFSYLMLFLPLRIFTGGYHAQNSEQCFVLSTVMYGITIAVTKFIPLLYQDWYWRITGIISVLVILLLTPLINENNPLNKIQKNRNRIVVYLLLIADFVFFILCCNFKWTIGSNVLVFVIWDALLLAIAKIDKLIPNSKY